jgi:hypothetical protein
MLSPVGGAPDVAAGPRAATEARTNSTARPTATAEARTRAATGCRTDPWWRPMEGSRRAPGDVADPASRPLRPLRWVPVASTTCRRATVVRCRGMRRGGARYSRGRSPATARVAGACSCAEHPPGERASYRRLERSVVIAGARPMSEDDAKAGAGPALNDPAASSTAAGEVTVVSVGQRLLAAGRAGRSSESPARSWWSGSSSGGCRS